MSEVFKTVVKSVSDGRINIIEIWDDGLHATAGRVADLLPKLKDGTHTELVITVSERG